MSEPDKPGASPAAQPAAPTTPTPAGAAPAAAPSASGPKPTLAGGAEPKPTPTPAAPASPQQAAAEVTWRDRLAGEDKDFRKQLDRYADEPSVGRKLRELEKKLSSGEMKPAATPFPNTGTPEEQGEWRKTFGIPEAPDEYLAKIALPDGVVLGEADKPVAADFASWAHERNWKPEQYNEALGWYYKHLDKVTAERDAADDRYQQQSRDAMRDTWGPKDFTRNINAVHNLLSTAPAEVREPLLGGRTADGRLIGDDPRVLKWLAQVALDLNPAASVLPAGPGTVSSVDDEIEKIRTLRREDPNKYDQDKKLQARELELLEAQIKLKNRGKAA